MKRLITATLLVHSFAVQASCEMQADCKWENLDTTASLENQQTFGGKWILAATITFKNKTTETMYLHEIDLEWGGITLSKLNATLFRCDPLRIFVPLEENVIADGTWSEYYQTLQFSFKTPERLQPTHTFALVLTIPAELETEIKTGHFKLLPKTLPQPLQTSAQEHPLFVHFVAPSKTPQLVS